MWQWSHKSHSIPRPYWHAMECLLWVFWGQMPCYIECISLYLTMLQDATHCATSGCAITKAILTKSTPLRHYNELLYSKTLPGSICRHTHTHPDKPKECRSVIISLRDKGIIYVYLKPKLWWYITVESFFVWQYQCVLKTLSSNVVLWCFLCIEAKQLSKQTLRGLVIWDHIYGTLRCFDDWSNPVIFSRIPIRHNVMTYCEYWYTS